MKHLGAVSANIETSTRAKEFIALARCVALARGTHGMTAKIAEEARLSRAVLSVLDGPKIYDLGLTQRAAVEVGSTTDADWALPLAEYDVLARSFLESLRSFGAFDRMLPSMRRVPLRTRIGASSVGITATTVAQSAPKPISRLTLSGTQIDELKAVAILIVTEELARFSSSTAGDLFAVELQNAVAVETDEQFLSILTSGATSIGSSGVTAEHVRNDLRALLAAVTTSARSVLFLLMPPAIAKVLALLHSNSGDAAFPGLSYKGGPIAGGIEVVVSDGVPASTMVLVDAQQVAAASDTVTLDTAREAVVQLDTAPDSPSTPSTNLVSLWQMNMLGLKAERFFGASKLTIGGVSVLTGASYLGDSPGP